MRIGFDIDGVLANFAKAYQNTVVAITGRDLFHPGDITNPPCWDWPQFRGYTEEEIKRVWMFISNVDTFWMNLEPFENNVGVLDCMLAELSGQHEIYFITNRSGARVKWQTELWLEDHLRFGETSDYPTVLISGQKGEVAHALKLDAYIDDNIADVAAKSPDTAAYLLNRSYNTDFASTSSFTRVNTLGEMFDEEIRKGRM